MHLNIKIMSIRTTYPQAEEMDFSAETRKAQQEVSDTQLDQISLKRPRNAPRERFKRVSCLMRGAAFQERKSHRTSYKYHK